MKITSNAQPPTAYAYTRPHNYHSNNFTKRDLQFMPWMHSGLDNLTAITTMLVTLES